MLDLEKDKSGDFAKTHANSVKVLNELQRSWI